MEQEARRATQLHDMSLPLLRSLCQSNERILQQKLLLLEIIERSNNSHIFQRICPLVGASIGQHLRHSTDHIELAARAAFQLSTELETSRHKTMIDTNKQKNTILNYDVRKRGGDDEICLQSARERILTIHHMTQSISKGDIQENLLHQRLERPIQVSFILGTVEKSSIETPLFSNILRELSFVAHHAIHHLAMIKIIGVNMKAFCETDLPADFGKAPSTVQHEATKINQ